MCGQRSRPPVTLLPVDQASQKGGFPKLQQGQGLVTQKEQSNDPFKSNFHEHSTYNEMDDDNSVLVLSIWCNSSPRK